MKKNKTEYSRDMSEAPFDEGFMVIPEEEQQTVLKNFQSACEEFLDRFGKEMSQKVDDLIGRLDRRETQLDRRLREVQAENEELRKEMSRLKSSTIRELNMNLRHGVPVPFVPVRDPCGIGLGAVTKTISERNKTLL